MKLLRTLAAASLVVFLLGRAAAAAPAAPARPGAPARPAVPAGMPPAAGSALQAKLPDTTLVRIFFAKGHSDVTLSQLRVGAYRLGVWPDSLTPPAMRQVLGLLAQQAILTHRVHEVKRHWTAEDSTDYRVLEDRLTVSAALDSALAAAGFAAAARGDSVPGREGLGILARDSALAGAHPVFDEASLQWLAGRFAALPHPTAAMGVMEQVTVGSTLPVIAREDSARTLVTSALVTVTAGQILTDLGRVPPTRRPQVRTLDDLRELCRSKVFEAALRRAAKDQRIARKPRIARQMAQAADELDLRRFLATQVYDKVPLDSTTLRRRYRAAPARYESPAHAVLVRMVLEQRGQADTLAHRLTEPAYAESLLAQSERAGSSFRAEVDARTDSVLYRRAVRGGVGAVIGPEQMRDGWRVVRVMELLPRRARTFEQAYSDVHDDWANTESNRLMGELLGRLSASTIMNVNQDSPYLTGRKRIPR